MALRPIPYPLCFIASLKWTDFYLLTELLLLDSGLAFGHQSMLRDTLWNNSMKFIAFTVGKLMRMWLTTSHGVLSRKTDRENVSQISVPGVDTFLLSKWFVFISWTLWNCINDYISHFVLALKSSEPNFQPIFSNDVYYI